MVLPIGWAVYYILSRYARLALDTHLELSADIGSGLYIGHFGNIRVRNCTIGASCSIAQSVHIIPDSSNVPPVIGDSVWIGAHAKIVGPFRIGSGATVSAAAVVRRDMPANALCLGNPARVIIRDYDNRRILDAR
jgi:serine O-acetyltransferase